MPRQVELAKKEADELARAEAKAKKESAPGRLLGMFKRPGEEAATKAEQDARAAGASAEACGKHRRTTRRIEPTPCS